MAPIERVCRWAAEHGLAVVEDACQAPGGTVDGKPAGSWGDASVLSFGGSKLLTAGRGGAVLSNRADVHQRIKVFGERGNQAFPLSELQAAVVLPQLDRLAERGAIRAARVERLLAATADLPGLGPLVQQSANAQPAYYKLAWLYDPAKLGGRTVEEFVAAARAEGAPVDLGFRGFALRSSRRCRSVGTLEHSRRAGEATVLLHHPILLAGEATIDQLSLALCKVVEHWRTR
jgi:dTDP-4-amino-4,6-dideoxygalactose transaminase